MRKPEILAPAGNLEKLKTYNIKEQAKVLEERYLKNG